MTPFTKKHLSAGLLAALLALPFLAALLMARANDQLKPAILSAFITTITVLALMLYRVQVRQSRYRPHQANVKNNARNVKAVNKFIFVLAVAVPVAPFLYAAYELWRTVSPTAAAGMMVVVGIAMMISIWGVRQQAATEAIPFSVDDVLKKPASTPKNSTIYGHLLPKLVDVGIVSFWGEDTAFAHRKHPIPMNAQAIQPFIKLNIPFWGRWLIVFGVRDENQHLIFQHELDVFLSQGEQFITPPARILIGDRTLSGEWKLEVSVNGTTIASHAFTWRSDTIDKLEGHIDADGEVDEELLPLLADNYAAPLSLDDLMTQKDSKTGKLNDGFS